MAELALVRSWSTFRRSTVKTLSGFSRAMEASSSTRLTRRCVTAQCCGARDGADFSGVARARLERHQNPDLSDAHPASGIRARIAGARLSLSTLAVCTGLRVPARQPGSWLYDELRTLLGFFMLCQGAFGTFLFQDPSDSQVIGQQ